MDKKQIRAAKIKRQQELLDAAKKAGNRSLTDTEQAEFDSLQREIDTLTARERDYGLDPTERRQLAELLMHKQKLRTQAKASDS